MTSHAGQTEASELTQTAETTARNRMELVRSERRTYHVNAESHTNPSTMAREVIGNADTGQQSDAWPKQRKSNHDMGADRG